MKGTAPEAVALKTGLGKVVGLLIGLRQNQDGGPPEGGAPVPESAKASADDAPKESDAVAKHDSS